MDIPGNFTVADSDRRILDQLGGFIPDRIFDFHAHLYDMSYLPVMAGPGTLFDECGAAGRREYMKRQCPLYPGYKELRLNVVSMPDPTMVDLANGNRDKCNAFLTGHLKQNPDDVGEAFVLPGDTDDDINGLLTHPNIKGLKCYHLTSAKKPTWHADISDYLPKSAWRAAHERRLYITLHMVKDAALADPENRRHIMEMTGKYPNATLILAHAARGFAAWTAAAGIKHIAHIPNIYIDVSAVCEPTAIIAAIRYAGPRRVLWGSDFPVSMQRGKCISLSDKFLWLDKGMLERTGAPEAESTNLVGVENLSALWQACEILDLSREDAEAIFYDNAAELADKR